MNVDRVKAVQKVTDQGKSFRLPATTELIAKSALDEEERPAKSELSFLYGNTPRRREKKQRYHGAQGDWRALEESLTAESSMSDHRPTTAFSSSECDWHEIPEIRMTPELEKDLRIIENRRHLDPKRFYKSTGTGRKKGQMPTRVHVGTVVVGAHEFYSGRLTRKERRKSILDEVMSDERIMKFTKNKFKTLQQAKQAKRRIIDPAAQRKKGVSKGWG